MGGLGCTEPQAITLVGVAQVQLLNPIATMNGHWLLYINGRFLQLAWPVLQANT